MFLRSTHVTACTSSHYYNCCRIFHEVDPSHFTYPLSQWWATTWPPAPHHSSALMNIFTHVSLGAWIRISLGNILMVEHWVLRCHVLNLMSFSSLIALANVRHYVVVIMAPSYIRMPSNMAASVFLLHYRKDPGILHFHPYLSVSTLLFLPVS